MADGVVQASEEETPQGGRCLQYWLPSAWTHTYASSQAAAERTLESIPIWIERHLRLKANPAKSGTGRTWEPKLPGFQTDPHETDSIAPESVERFKVKVRELWRSGQSQT